MKLPYLVAALALTTTVASAQSTIPLWPHGVPDAVTLKGPENSKTSGPSGKDLQLFDVSVPQMLVYLPKDAVKNTGAGLVVFPGGGYQFLQWTHAGVDVCDWATSVGITCFLVKYRVPSEGPPPGNKIPLDDGQQAMRIARARASEWHVDPKRLGAIGFSAGGNLTVMLGTHADDAHVLSTKAAADVPMVDGKPVDAKPSFLVHCWPGSILIKPDVKVLDPYYKPAAGIPPTFIIQAEDDPLVGVSSPVLFRALMDAHVPAELHMYATGKHAFGMHPPNASQTDWPNNALLPWLRFNKFVP